MYNQGLQTEMLSQVRVQELMREANHTRMVRLAQAAKNESKSNHSRRLPLFSRFGRATSAGINH